MKTFIKRWLVPPFLKRWDAYLLVHHPMLWHSRAVWVLFYGLLAAPFLFAAGFFYPLDAQHLRVDPVKPIEMAYDAYYLYTVLFLSFGLLYWAFRQYQTGFPFSRAKEVLLTVCLYALCFWVLLGITAPAFRMGTIYKTAYHWMSDEDLKTLEESGIYPYGFVLLEGDTAFTTPPADTFFQRREELFKSICRLEDTLLQNNYQVTPLFWEQWFREHRLGYGEYWTSPSTSMLSPPLSYKLNRSDLSYMSSYSYLLHSSKKFDLLRSIYAENHSYLPHGSYRLYMSYRWYPSHWAAHSHESNDLYLSNRSYLSYLSYLSYWPNQLDKPNQLDWADQSYKYFKSSGLDTLIHAFSIYKKTPTFPSNFDYYRFANSNAPAPIHLAEGNIIWLNRSALPHSIENAVRSVKHTRLYWEEGIYFRHLFYLRHYLLLAALVLLALPLLRLKNVVAVVVGVAAAFIVIKAAGFYDSWKSLTVYWAIMQYLVLPALALGCLGISVIKKRHYPTVLFFLTLAIINLFIPLFVIGVSDYLEPIDYEYYPSNFAFYGLQALALVAALLMPYVRALPKVD